MADWLSIHVFYQGNQDRLLTEAVVPALDQLTRCGSAARWFFLRYWEGGPHLRVRMRVRPGRADAATGQLFELVTGYLRANPSRLWLDAAGYQQLASMLASWERRSDYEISMRPNDSVAVVPYQPERDVYGDGESLASAERHFVESSQIALEVIAAAVTRPRRCGLVLSAGLLTLAVLEPDLPRLAASFVAVGPLPSALANGPPWWRPRSGSYAQFEAAFLRQRQRLRAQARAAWDLAAADGSPAEEEADTDTRALGAWASSIGRLTDDLARSACHLPSEAFSSYSPLLRSLPASRHASGAITLRCTHLLANRLGVGPADEAYVRFLIARTLADLGAQAAGCPQEGR